MRKILIISGVVLVILLAGIYFFFSGSKHNTSYFKDHSAFMAVPSRSSLVLEVNDLGKFFQEISIKKGFTDDLMAFDEYAKLFDDILKIGNLKLENPSFSKLISGRSLIISVNHTGKNELSCLFLSALKSESDINAIIELVKSGTGKKYQLRKRAYDNTTIYNAVSSGSEFYFAFSQGIFMASKNAILLEEAVRQSNTQGLMDSQGFGKLYNMVSSSSALNVYINHRTIYQLLTKLTSRELRKSVADFSNFADWTALDVSIQPNDLMLSGYTFSNDSNDNFLSVIKKQDPQRTFLESFMPFNTSYFLELNLEDSEDYFENYKVYAKAHRQFYLRETKLINFQKEIKIEPIKLINEIAANNFAVVYTNVNRSNLEENRFFIMSLKDKNLAKDVMLKLLSNYATSNEIDVSSLKYYLGQENGNKIEIYKFPYSSFAEVLFGNIFSGVKCNYFTITDNHLIFGDSQFGIKKYLTDLRYTGSLENDEYYKRFKQKLSNQANIYLYADISRFFYQKQLLFNDEINSILTDNEEQVRHFHALGWQVSFSDDVFQNQIYLRYDPQKKEEPQPIWQCKLDSTVAVKPVFVLNHKDLKNKEIMVQDLKNNLYLISNEGNIKWKVKMPGRIVSEIQQVDAYRNNKFQYMFNTKDKLYLLDINGNNVGRFPITLKAEATNGVSIVDYDNSRNYRFFIACTDLNIYAYDRDGSFVKGWAPEKTGSRVKVPIKHLRLEGDDYLIFSDEKKTYFLNRRGETKVNSSTVFAHSTNGQVFESGNQPRIISSDKSGTIYREYFDGRFDKKELVKINNEGSVSPIDINSDGLMEYVFFDDKKLSVYTYDGRNVFDYKFTNSAVSTPELFTLSSEKKLGVTIKNENRIYLINQDGTLYNGFPVSGVSSFSIGKTNDSNDYYSLIVGRENNILCNYRIE